MGTWRPVTLTIADRWGPLPPHADPPPRQVLRWLERALLTIAIVCLAYYGYVSAETALYQAYEERELDKILANQATLLANQETIQTNQEKLDRAIGNQATILSNQDTIQSNQDTIQSNQREILANQREILANQKKILSK